MTTAIDAGHWTREPTITLAVRGSCGHEWVASTSRVARIQAVGLPESERVRLRCPECGGQRDVTEARHERACVGCGARISRYNAGATWCQPCRRAGRGADPDEVARRADGANAADILDALEAGPMTAGQIKEATGVAKAVLYVTLNRLVRAGKLRRYRPRGESWTYALVKRAPE